MSATVLPFANKERAEQAWAEFQALKQKEIANPKLGIDREFQQDLIRAYAKFSRLFLEEERQG